MKHKGLKKDKHQLLRFLHEMRSEGPPLSRVMPSKVFQEKQTSWTVKVGAFKEWVISNGKFMLGVLATSPSKLVNIFASFLESAWCLAVWTFFAFAQEPFFPLYEY